MGMASFKTISGWFSLVLAGCLTEVRTSCLSFLGPDQSCTKLASPPHEAALKVAGRFEVRGLQLIYAHPTDLPGQIVMKFINWPHRRIYVSEVEEAVRHQVGSAYYAWITPAPSGGGSLVRLVGKSTFDGTEPCSWDTPQLACRAVEVAPGLADDLSGRAEALTIEGVLAELALEVPISGPQGPSLVSSTPPEALDCRARRHQIFLEAGKLADIPGRARLLKTAPECP